MGEHDGMIHGPAVGAEDAEEAALPTEEEELEAHRADLRERRLREEEPDPNQHGPAVTDQEE